MVRLGSGTRNTARPSQQSLTLVGPGLCIRLVLTSTAKHDVCKYSVQASLASTRKNERRTHVPLIPEGVET